MNKIEYWNRDIKGLICKYNMPRIKERENILFEIVLFVFNSQDEKLNEYFQEMKTKCHRVSSDTIRKKIQKLIDDEEIIQLTLSEEFQWLKSRDEDRDMSQLEFCKMMAGGRYLFRKFLKLMEIFWGERISGDRGISHEKTIVPRLIISYLHSRDEIFRTNSTSL